MRQKKESPLGLVVSSTKDTQPYKQARAELLQELIKIRVYISSYQLYLITLYRTRLRQCGPAHPRLLAQLQWVMEHPFSRLPSGSDFSPVVQAVSIRSKASFISCMQIFHDCIFFFHSLPWSRVSCAQAEDAKKERCLPAVASIVTSPSFAIHGEAAGVEKPCSLSEGLPSFLHRHVQNCSLL